MGKHKPGHIPDCELRVGSSVTFLPHPPESILTQQQGNVTTVRFPEQTKPEWFSNDLSALRKNQVVQTTHITAPGVTLDRIVHKVIHSPWFIHEYHRRRGDEDLEVVPWTGMGVGARYLQTRVTIHVPFKAKGMLYSGQRYACGTLPDGRRSLLWHFSTETPDFPYCTTFRTEVLVEFSERGGGGGIEAAVYCAATFHTWSFVEGFIRPRVNSESAGSMQQLIDMAVEVCSYGGGAAEHHDVVNSVRLMNAARALRQRRRHEEEKEDKTTKEETIVQKGEKEDNNIYITQNKPVMVHSRRRATTGGHHLHYPKHVHTHNPKQNVLFASLHQIIMATFMILLVAVAAAGSIYVAANVNINL